MPIVPQSFYVAGVRESGTLCPHCHEEIELGQRVTACDDCGSVQHAACWKAGGGCGDYQCAPARGGSRAGGGEVISIGRDDLESAVPLPPSSPVPRGPAISVPVGPDPESTRWNKLAIAAFVVAVLGIPLFGLVTGLVAVLLGGIALSGRKSFRRRGIALAVGAILLGIADFVGWTIGMAAFVDFPAGQGVVLDHFEPDPEALADLPAPINRAMKANVLIQTGGFLGGGLGSGVILRIANGSALVVTNRHVVDSDFAEGDVDVPDDLAGVGEMMVKLIGQPAVRGELVWLAPHGVDLALVRVPVVSEEPLSANWDGEAPPRVRGEVFAVGNPQGLEWSLTDGNISALRRKRIDGDFTYRVIQTSAAINPGNSGGGLYDEQGRLIGINTWTRDKRFAEGLGFAIAFPALLELAPPRFDLPAQQMQGDPP